MVELYEGIVHILGLGKDAAELGFVHLLARAVTIYGATLVVIRLGRNRFTGRAAGLDVLLGFVIGSLYCRALTEADTNFQTAAAAGAMVAAHWLVSYGVARSRRYEAALSELEQRAPPAPPLTTARTAPRVLEVQVAEGVQTVRIALGS